MWYRLYLGMKFSFTPSSSVNDRNRKDFEQGSYLNKPIAILSLAWWKQIVHTSIFICSVRLKRGSLRITKKDENLLHELILRLLRRRVDWLTHARSKSWLNVIEYFSEAVHIIDVITQNK